ncbi:MAG TPA: UDP-glucose 4-epimerase GalE [Nostocaceae cyanobacterium]|nr:UDP-glucose 4-epimerase GalE [Nostocaceae cyanobacterium]
MNFKRKILITGGAGYIGSHVVQQLGEAGYDLFIYDNCSTGLATSVLYGKLIIGDLGDIDHLYQVFSQYQFDAVLHFAGSLIVSESITNPLEYYANNTRNTLNLLQCCSATNVNQIIFSSTAAVYGEPEKNPVAETARTLPINPYGRSKLMSEWLIQDYEKASGLRYVILRYFNVAGADPRGNLKLTNENATQLIRVACDAALGKRKNLSIFGTNFPTSDGTAIRDYIHVEDLASAHVAALHYLEQGGESQILNCGYGYGYSVRQVIERVKAISNIDFPVLEVERRLGDPASVVACVDRISQVLNWKPIYADLDVIVQTTLAGQKQLLKYENMQNSSVNRFNLQQSNLNSSTVLSAVQGNKLCN